MTPGQLYVAISVLSAKEAVKLIQQAKEEWCEAQRANCCANARIDTAWYKGEPSSLIDANSILNAPEP